MKNIYFFYGNDIEEISSHTDLLVHEKCITSQINDLKRYEIGTQEELDNFYDLESTISLFSEQSILKLSFSQQGFKLIEKNHEEFIDKLHFLSKSKVIYILILFIKYDKTTKSHLQKSDLCKSLSDIAETKEFEKLKYWQKNEIKNKISEHAKMLDLKINPDALSLLHEIFKDNPSTILSELEKIKTYLCPSNNVTCEIVHELYMSSFNVDDLYDYLLLKKIKLSDLEAGFNKSIAPLYLIAILQNKLREAYKIKFLVLQKTSKQEIAKLIAIHPYKLDLLISKLNNVSIEYLNNLILQLSDFEYRLKSGRIEESTVIDKILLLK
ncbi:MAG: hypothetical protein HYR97_09205 [Candidatus Melainabacteria bacterium]|nr:hypothetical protein [Candidatus Melainabacteria bacterium]